MARIAILSDIHSNWQALQAVLREVQTSRIDRVICLGDVVGYGANPARCVQMLRQLKAGMVMGNHEYEMLLVRRWGTEHLDADWRSDGYQAGLVHSARELDQGQIDWLTSIPAWAELEQSLVAHANLEDPMRFGYIESVDDALPTLEVLKNRSAAVGFFGHTHQQQVFYNKADDLEWIDETTFRVHPQHPCAVMVGSVGQSRMEGDLRAAWAIYDSAASVVEFRRTEYDRLAAAKSMIAAGLPRESALRLLTEKECETNLVGG